MMNRGETENTILYDTKGFLTVSSSKEILYKVGLIHCPERATTTSLRSYQRRVGRKAREFLEVTYEGDVKKNPEGSN